MFQACRSYWSAAVSNSQENDIGLQHDQAGCALWLQQALTSSMRKRELFAPAVAACSHWHKVGMCH